MPPDAAGISSFVLLFRRRLAFLDGAVAEISPAGRGLAMKRLSMSPVLFSMLVCAAIISSAEAAELLFKDGQYSFQMLRAVAAVPGGAADVGECLATGYRIKEGDDESWYREWLATAERREKTGDEFLDHGRRTSARQEFLRASNYYRTAEFFLRSDPRDPRIVDTWRKGRDSFLKFARLADHPILPVEIPFEGKMLPGYLCLVDKSGKKRPLFIIQTGFDGTKEEIYYTNAAFAVKRGYNCLLFEGPGQGQVIREQKIPFRHNWETVVTPVVDFALKRREVDPKRIAYMGISFGGYLAPRAVAYEHRIRACIVNGGVYDFHAVVAKEGVGRYLDDPNGAREVDKQIVETMKKDSSLRWVFGNGLFTFGAKSPSEWIRMTRPYTMKDSAPKIRCRMLVVDSEGDKDMPGQARQLYDTLQCPKDFMLFTKDDGAEEHCQVGAAYFSNARILDWLDDAMKGPPSKR